jgi:hypothetical protein
MQTTSPIITRYFRVARRDLVYLKFILEAYEGLSTLTTVEKREAVVRVTYGAEFHGVMEDLLRALGEEISLGETSAPHEGDNEHA